jgi:4-hydroxy-tetrahydrodipicolinate synthase
MTFNPGLSAHDRASRDEKRAPWLAGVFTDLVTPFRDDRIDEEAFVAMVERQIAAGAQGVVVASGAAGERPTLRDGEASRLIALAVKTTNGRAKVVADAGSNATAFARRLVDEARGFGADAVLVAPPWYNRPSQEGVLRHFESIAGVDAPPILVWDCPERTSLALSIPTLQHLADLPGVIGIVDASGDMSRVSELRRLCPNWSLLSGHDPSTLGYLAQGGHGCVSLAANVCPDAVCALDAAWALQDGREARRIHDGLADLMELLGLDPAPAAAKLALSLGGLCRSDVRLPITPCPEATQACLQRAMRTMRDWA